MLVKCRGFEGTLKSLDVAYYIEDVVVYEVDIYLNDSFDYVHLDHVFAHEIEFLTNNQE